MHFHLATLLVTAIGLATATPVPDTEIVIMVPPNTAKSQNFLTHNPIERHKYAAPQGCLMLCVGEDLKCPEGLVSLPC